MRKEFNIVYYISKALLNAETKYSKIKKWTLALIIIARKLRPYFHVYPIIVMIDQPP